MKKMVFMRGFYPDPRCEKRLNLLVTKFNIALIYWEKNANNIQIFEFPNVKCIQLKIKANPTNPIKRILPYRMFLKESLKKIKEEAPSIIYAEALDMLEIAYIYKLKYDRNVKIIYEVADLHRFIVDKPKNYRMAIIQKVMKYLDRRNCKYVDILIITSEKYFDSYFAKFISKKKVLFIPNVPDVDCLRGYKRKKQEGNFTIGFVGGIRYIEQIKLLLDAAKQAKWNVLLAGSENGTQIKDISLKLPNVEYMGRFDYNSQIASIYGKCDMVYSVYNADMVNVKLALPNKLYEAIYCELPLIVAKNTYLQELVEKWGIGVSIQHNDSLELINVLNYITNNPEYYDTMVQNCIKCKSKIDLSKYNEKLLSKISLLLEN